MINIPATQFSTLSERGKLVTLAEERRNTANLQRRNTANPQRRNTANLQRRNTANLQRPDKDSLRCRSVFRRISYKLTRPIR